MAFDWRGLEWDQAKNEANRRRGRPRFDKVVEFDWSTALVFEDTAHSQTEPRFLAYGMIERRLHALVYTPRGDVCRVISLRKANRRERTRFQNVFND